MKKLALFVFLLILAVFLSSCGSGGLFGGTSSSNAARGDTGSMTVTVNWPSSAKTTVLENTYSLKVNVCTVARDAGTTVYNREVNAIIIRRNASNSTETVTINGIPIGAVTVVSQAYDTVGTEIGYGTTDVVIKAGDNDQALVTLASGTFGYSFIGKSDAVVPTQTGDTTNPQITKLNPTSGQVGVAVIIDGYNFGDNQGSSTVKFNGIEAITVTSWTNSRIICSVPTGASTGNVVVTVNGTASNSVPFTVSTSATGPYITALDPAAGTYGTAVAITGRNFGSQQATTSSVTFNGAAALVTSWSDTRITCVVPTTASTGNVVVTVNNRASNGVVFTVSTDYNWAAMDAPANAGDLMAVYGFASNNVIAVGAGIVGSQKIASHYNGAAWIAKNVPTASELCSVWGGSPQLVYAGGTDYTNDNSPFLSYSDNMWNFGSVNGIAHIRGIWGASSNNNIYAVGNNKYNNGKIMKSYNGEWTDMYISPIVPPNICYAVWGTSADNVYIVGGNFEGTSGKILRYNNQQWTEYPQYPSVISNPLRGIWGTSSGNIFVVGEGGTILRYDGTNWITDTSAGITTRNLYAVWGSSPTDVFAVGQDGTIIHYDGTSWSAMASGTTNCLYGVWGSGSSDVFAVGSGGTILHYGPNAEIN
ncbi:MAG: IPT/TIG domain-containing protein [Armatimonadota bacterium]